MMREISASSESDADARTYEANSKMSDKEIAEMAGRMARFNKTYGN
jgi:hypothetical protein